MTMKTTRLIVLSAFLMLMMSSCKVFAPKYGCPTNGKNVGAEKLLGGDAASEKAVRKAKKFKS